jgi:hypothetical protein
MREQMERTKGPRGNLGDGAKPWDNPKCGLPRLWHCGYV